MRLLDLFSGIGGFSLAAQWVWRDELEIVAFVEIDKFCQKVLAKHWPNVPIIGDVRDVTADIITNNEKSLNGQGVFRKSKGQIQESGKRTFAGIDLITAGVPCQPASCAGKRRGKEDDRWLWPEAIRIVSEFGYSSRTSLVSSLLKAEWYSTICFLTWKLKGIGRKRFVFQLVPSMPRTEETGFGLWPTPRTGKTTDENEESWMKRHERGEVATPPLALAVKMHPTPTNSMVTEADFIQAKFHSSKRPSYQDAKMWPTSTTRDYRHSGSKEGYEKRKGKHVQALNEQVCWGENGLQTGGSLNPTWIEWLMGFPLGWTDLNHSETP
jgi:hypothetical protein